MKEKYLKYKGNIKSLLALGTTFSAIGLFAAIGGSLLFGILLLVSGMISLFFAYKLKIETVKIETYCKEKCPICNNTISYSMETKFYLADNLVSEEDFNKCNKYVDKIKREIHYYKCIEDNFCMTIIHSYLITNTKQKQLNDKISLDFNYNFDY